MSSSDYLTAKKKLILYNTTSTRSTNNTNISHSVANSSSLLNNRYYATREELSASNQVNCYESYINSIDTDLDNDNNPGTISGISICNVKNNYSIVDGTHIINNTIHTFERLTKTTLPEQNNETVQFVQTTFPINFTDKTIKGLELSGDNNTFIAHTEDKDTSLNSVDIYKRSNDNFWNSMPSSTITDSTDVQNLPNISNISLDSMVINPRSIDNEVIISSTINTDSERVLVYTKQGNNHNFKLYNNNDGVLSSQPVVTTIQTPENLSFYTDYKFNTLVVGNTTSVSVYKYNGTAWSEPYLINGISIYDLVLSADGNTIATFSGLYPTSVSIYKYSGSVWSEYHTLTRSDDKSFRGIKLSYDGNSFASLIIRQGASTNTSSKLVEIYDISDKDNIVKKNIETSHYIGGYYFSDDGNLLLILERYDDKTQLFDDFMNIYYKNNNQWEVLISNITPENPETEGIYYPVFDENNNHFLLFYRRKNLSLEGNNYMYIYERVGNTIKPPVKVDVTIPNIANPENIILSTDANYVLLNFIDNKGERYIQQYIR